MPRRLLSLRRIASLVPAVALTLTGCASSSTPTVTTRTPPDIQAFLRLPVATPSSCPPTANGTTSGRRSPWVGHVDVSVFLTPAASRAGVAALRRALEAEPQVRTVYFESQREAYAEFQRLYTCSAALDPSQLPASFRLVLHAVTRAQRDDLVRRIHRLAGVADISCDPSSPCIDVRSR